MYLVAMGWLYVAVMMSAAEAMHPNGTILGAIVTFLLYGLLPIGLVLYVLGTPMRRKARQEKEAAEEMAARAAGTAVLAALAPAQNPQPSNTLSAETNASSHATSGAQSSSVAPMGKPD